VGSSVQNSLVGLWKTWGLHFPGKLGFSTFPEFRVSSWHETWGFQQTYLQQRHEFGQRLEDRRFCGCCREYNDLR
jgi:hypothetical protein